MEKIISLAKRRGFVFPGSEIYGGLASTFDYGPMGVELKNNLKQLWWQYFVHQREDMTGIDGGILMSPKIWEASGHVQNFKDPLVECKKCHHRFRPDKLADASKCPDCGGEFTEVKMFSGMFETTVGAIKEDGLTVYLRPETAQSIFANFKNVLDSGNKKMPFGIGQIGKAFRNEITTGNFIFRTLEFEQGEIEFFLSPDADWSTHFSSWLEYMYGFADRIGLPRSQFVNHEIPDGERAFYSKRTIDIEYQFPFGQDELWAIAYRTDYDLSRHQDASGKKLEYFDEGEKKHYIPHVIEPTFGIDRTFLAVLSNAFDDSDPERTVLHLKPALAPYKVAVFPLLKNKPELVAKAREIFTMMRSDFAAVWDERGNIGKRYLSQDEIGTPACITIDFQTLEDSTVTVRDRDTKEQSRVALQSLREYLRDRYAI
ncbi:MAG: glycine--tRNA ligase [Candidatus Pacebacteria bacterium]|nr:glycine--tRNA ligase [Candidatus Paceibacterota bacterium]